VVGSYNLAAWLEHAVDFPEVGVLIRDALKQVLREDDVEQAVIERQALLDVGDSECQTLVGATSISAGSATSSFTWVMIS